MVYKKGPRYRARPVSEIKEDLLEARRVHGKNVKTLFFPAGNSIAVETDELCEICRFAKKTFPRLERVTVYGSSRYILQKGPQDMKRLADAGLSRIHVGLESGDDEILKRIRKGSTAAEQVRAGRMTMEAGIELSLYVILGIGGKERTREHARETARVLTDISPDFTRLRTFVPKIGTPLLRDVERGVFQMLGPRGILRETEEILREIDSPTFLTSDHYTNYIDLEGRLPEDRRKLLDRIAVALERNEDSFRPFFVGDQ
jgi:radical SAM superfamily enzyme YgiQ (UPF0313 family)